MKSFFEKITVGKFKDLLNFIGGKDLVLEDLSFSISTDRNSIGLVNEIVEYSKKIHKICEILDCTPNDLEMSFNSDESDHEIATHSLNLNNNKYVIGSYASFHNELVIIVDINYSKKIATFKTMEGKEDFSSLDALDNISWFDVFYKRDNIDLYNFIDGLKVY